MSKSRRSIRHQILLQLLKHLKTTYNYEPLPDALKALLYSAAGIDTLLSFRSDSHLDDLRGALLRLEAGTFGICIACKKWIPTSVLYVDITRRICVPCEEAFSHPRVAAKVPVASTLTT